MPKRIKTDEFDQFHDYGVYSPARIIDLSGEIDEDNAVEFIKNIRLLDHANDQDITVLIKSEGGDVSQGMAIYDSVKECNSKVITHAVGPCYSMASIIFQAGDHRKISANATVMIHTGKEGYPEDHPLNNERWLAENKRLGKIADNILFEKIKKKKPRFQRKRFEELLVFDTIYTSEQAVEMGLADEIATHKEF